MLVFFFVVFFFFIFTLRIEYKMIVMKFHMLTQEFKWILILNFSLLLTSFLLYATFSFFLVTNVIKQGRTVMNCSFRRLYTTCWLWIYVYLINTVTEKKCVYLNNNILGQLVIWGTQVLILALPFKSMLVLNNLSFFFSLNL